MISANLDALFLENTSSMTAEMGSVMTWVQRRLGAPVLKVELDTVQYESAFEEALIEYSSQIAQFKAKNSYLSLIGIRKDTNLEQYSAMPSGAFVRKYIQQFDTAAGAGGAVTYNKGYIQTNSGRTRYSLKNELRNVSDGNPISYSGQIIPKYVYHSKAPSGFRYFDPYASNFALMGELGRGDAYAMNSKVFQVFPIWDNLLRFQWFENYDKIFRSQYKWNIVGDQLTITPIPKYNLRLFIDWIDSESWESAYGNAISSTFMGNLSASISAFTTDITNIPFNNLTYDKINDFSKNWIRQYTLAICKEMLGLIRSKSLTVPIPDGELTMNYAELLIEGKEGQSKLKSELSEFLNSIISSESLKRESEILDVTNKYLRQTPLKIYLK